jgi:hypothetical protein
MFAVVVAHNCEVAVTRVAVVVYYSNGIVLAPPGIINLCGTLIKKIDN